MNAGSVSRLSAEGLTLRRGTRTLFSGLTFALESGQALILRGANGSGKTSLLRVLAGLTRPDAGAIFWEGEKISPFNKQLAAATRYLGHLNSVKDDLTSLENLADALALDGSPLTGTVLKSALDSVGLRTQRDLAARRLSQGQKRRIGLAHLTLCKKSLWLLDEPTNALDADGVTLFARLVDAHLAGGGLACIATHTEIPLAKPGRVLDLSAAS